MQKTSLLSAIKHEGRFFVMQQSNVETFAAYSQFKSLKDFNNNLESFLSIHKKDLTPNEVHCFKALSRFAVRCLGVSNISINKLLKAISNKFKTVSESTFHRFKRKAIQLGILSVYPLSRSNGSQSSNLWVFNRFISNDTPKEGTREGYSPVKQQSKEKAVTSPKANNIKTNKPLLSDIRIQSADPFIDYCSYFFDNKTIKRLKEISIVHSRINSLHAEDSLKASLESVKVLVSKMRSKPISNVCGFYNGIISKVSKRIKITSLWDEVWEIQASSWSSNI